AINIRQRDIEQLGFRGTYYDDSFVAGNTTRAAATSPAADCFEGANNASFPDLASTTNLSNIYAKVAEESKELNCVINPVINTDIIQVKLLQ
ncbi:pilus assembly protein PilW, partial [Pseudoalteromonas sp. S185]